MTLLTKEEFDFKVANGAKIAVVGGQDKFPEVGFDGIPTGRMIRYLKDGDYNPEGGTLTKGMVVSD